MFLAFRKAEIATLTEASNRLSSDVCTLPAITATTRHGRSRFHLSLFLPGTVPTSRRNDHVEIVSTNILSRRVSIMQTIRYQIGHYHKN